jgi:hypothetical protein
MLHQKENEGVADRLGEQCDEPRLDTATVQKMPIRAQLTKGSAHCLHGLPKPYDLRLYA